MPERLPIRPEPRRFRWPLVVILAGSLLILFWFKLQGLLLLLPILAIALPRAGQATGFHGDECAALLHRPVGGGHQRRARRV
ncbi:hypothetical protein QP028_14325 [Corynebacterium suedekumii]|nr:hypothetical protein QP028_14325 [Corynebacterium suedekumii]